MHLALGRRARLRQVQFVSELISNQRHAIVMGDMNCSCESDEMQLLMKNSNLRQSGCGSGTFPSWRPMRRIEHILVSDSLLVENVAPDLSDVAVSSLSAEKDWTSSNTTPGPRANPPTTLPEWIINR